MSMKDIFEKAGYRAGGTSNASGKQKQWQKSQGGQGVAARQPGMSFNPPKILLRSNGTLRRGLLTSDAEEWADLLYNNKEGVTASQLRNFYNEVKALQSRIEAGGFSSNEAMIGLLKSKAAYAWARAETKRKRGFEYLKSMIEQGADLSTSEEAFNDFALFFEAVMGFFKGGKP